MFGRISSALPARKTSRRPIGPCSLLGMALLWANPGDLWAVDQLTVELGTLAGADWRLEDARSQLALRADGTLALELQAAALHLPAPVGTLRALHLSCPRLQQRASQWRCAAGRLQARHPALPAQDAALSFRYDSDSGALDLELEPLTVAQGNATVRIRGAAGRWQLAMQLQEVSLPELLGLLPAAPLPADWQVDTRIAGTLNAQLADGQLAELQWDLDMPALAFSGPRGVYAAEDIGLNLQGDAQRRGAAWSLAGQMRAARGTLCLSACWDLPAEGIAVEWRGDWRTDSQVLHLGEWRVRDGERLQANGSLRVGTAEGVQVQQAEGRLATESVEGLYQTYLQPLLIGTLFDQVAAAGQLQAQLQYDQTAGLAIDAQLQNVSVQDPLNRFGVHGLGGELRWSGDGPPQPGRLRWDRAQLYQLPIGATDLQFTATGGDVRLVSDTAIPMFDGELRVGKFQLHDAGEPDMAWQLEAVLTPLSMEAFSRAMGWPEMAGALSGVIPTLQYADRRLSVNGVLLIRAFDGEATIRNLQVENLLGVVPTLNADVQLRNIDLQQLTGTFSFGRIEGRLGGAMNGLVLQNWHPVAFDARFATPEGDRSRHRISQRAVDNLTSLGGGVGGALSRSFLRFFDDFSYDRLGLSCRLHNGVCEMDGVAPAPEGYYIVKGGGLPRIDVIGYQRRVDWQVLTKRLEAVTSGDGPVIR